jgi:hypothetical protein
MIKERLVSQNPRLPPPPLFKPFSKAIYLRQHLQTPAQNKSRSNVFSAGEKHLPRKQLFFLAGAGKLLNK